MMELKTFAVTVYSDTDVADACLSLQDENQVDVPLLLFCGWYGAFYGQLPAQHLQQALEISRQLGTHLIKPLRDARRWMKTHSVEVDVEQRWSQLREEIKRAELDAELLMLDTLSTLVLKFAEHADAVNATQQQQTDILQNMHLLLAPQTTTAAAEQNLRLISRACLETAHSA